MSFLQSVIDAIALGAVYGVVALGIGLVFGVMRLVNFAYGELITAGGFTLAYLSGQPAIVAILACFAVVAAFALVQERIFRPLRTAAPATMLVATFAVSFLLQNVFLLAFGSRGKTVGTLGGLNTALAVGSLRIRWISIVAVVVGGVLLAATGLLLNRTTIGVQIRAAAADFRTARLLGVRANRVIAFSFLVSGFLAAAVAVLLTVQTPLVTPDFGVQVTIFALVGVVVGGSRPALVGDARRLRDRVRHLVRRRPAALVEQRLPAVGDLRARDHRPPPAARGPVRRLPRERRGACVRRRLDPLVSLLAPVLLVTLVAVVGSQMGFARQLEFDDALVSTAIVVALYVFVGNSGVISFGHISFVAVGAYLSGILTLGAEQKDFVIPTMYPFLRHAHVATVPSLALAALAGAVFALLVGIPLMRLSGLPAGIATFAVLGITYNLISYWQKIGPGVTALALVPESGIWTLFVGTLITIVVAFAYSLSRSGRKLRATREDPQAAQSAGIHVHRQRLVAFVISGALAGFAGGLLVHELGSITTDQVYLPLTFITLAMLVVGGATSLWGAVVGALVISGLNSLLNDAEQGIHIGFRLDLPDGTRLVAIGVVMAAILILRPSGITGGREVTLRRRRG